MINITITYLKEEMIDFCAGVTLSRIYDNTDNERNNKMLDLYGITRDDMEVFEKHCLKYACNYVYMALKRNTWGRIPFEYSVLDNTSGNFIITYRLKIGRTLSHPEIEYGNFNEIISDYMALAIRDYALKEWYKIKGNLDWAKFHEVEFEINKRKLLDLTQGFNSDNGSINIDRKPGYPFN